MVNFNSIEKRPARDVDFYLERTAEATSFNNLSVTLSKNEAWSDLKWRRSYISFGVC